jgi:hypothetical protein
LRPADRRCVSNADRPGGGVGRPKAIRGMKKLFPSGHGH